VTKGPNTRVQRTRSSASPPRSPLTRHPLGGVGFAVFLFALATVSSAAPGTVELSAKPSDKSSTTVVVEARNTSDEPISLVPFSAFELRAEGQKSELGFWARFSFRGDHRATHKNRAAVAIPKGEVVRADINLTALGWSLLPRSNWWTGYLRSVVPPGRYLLVVTADSDNGQRFESAPVLWVAKP
jgi:hypothetical protein